MILKKDMIIMKAIFFISISISMFLMKACSQDSDAVIAIFPKTSEPIQITEDGKEYMFASYHAINSWSKSQRYVTVLQMDLKNTLPTEEDSALMGLVDLENENEFIPLAETRAWNFQQGNMAHWLGTSPDSLIIYNDMRDGQYVSVILNVHTEEERDVFPYPVAAVSPVGTEAISLNFSRIAEARPHYGYGGNGQNAQRDIKFPDDDGLFLLNFETGDAELIVTFRDIEDQVPDIEPGGMQYVDHVLFSKEGSRLMFLARAIPERNTTCFTVDRDGGNLQRCFPDHWGGSHFDWLTDNRLMVTAEYQGKQYSHILFTVGEDDYKRLGNGLLDYDGHGTFSPDGRWMVTDTYPEGGFNDQKIYIMDMETEAVLSLGRYPHSDEHLSFGTRCDIHVRWSPRGDMFGFNSTHTGYRQAFIVNVEAP